MQLLKDLRQVWNPAWTISRISLISTVTCRYREYIPYLTYRYPLQNLHQGIHQAESTRVPRGLREWSMESEIALPSSPESPRRDMIQLSGTRITQPFLQSPLHKFLLVLGEIDHSRHLNTVLTRLLNGSCR